MPDLTLFNNINEENVTNEINYRKNAQNLILNLNLDNKIYTDYINETSNNINKQNEVLYKQDKLLTINNNYLNEQIQKIDTIENNINSKDRLIYTANMQTKLYNKHIKILITSIIFAIIILFIVTLYNNYLKPMYFRIILTLIIVVYIFYIFYTYNILHFNDVFNFSKLKKTLNNIENNIINEINKDLNITEETLINYVYGSKENWMKNNCTSNPPIPIPAPIPTIPIEEEEETNYELNNGYYYYDSSTPAQLLVPSPTIYNSGKYLDRIKHVDGMNLDLNNRNLDTKIPGDNTWTNNL
jgi:hypothetical protein